MPDVKPRAAAPTDDDTAIARPEPPALTPSPTDALIERLFVAGIHNSSVARNTEIFNFVRAWVDDLKRHLKEI